MMMLSKYNNKMISQCGQQNKQPQEKNKIFNNKFLSIKSIIRNKKLVVKKSIPVPSSFYQNHTTYPHQMNSDFSPEKTNHIRGHSARGNCDDNDQNNSKNVIIIKFEKQISYCDKQKQPKLKRRILSNFTHQDTRKLNFSSKERILKDGSFEDTLTIEPIYKIQKDYSFQKKKKMDLILSNNCILLTKKSNKTQGLFGSNKTISDFKQIGKAITHSILKRGDGRKTVTSLGFKQAKYKNRHKNFLSNLYKDQMTAQMRESNSRKKDSIESCSFTQNQIFNKKQKSIQSDTELQTIQKEQSITNSPQNGLKQFKQLLPIRKPNANRKYHFVFSMSQKPTNQPTNKIQLYRDYLWKINYSNGLYVITPQNIDYSYKAYFGPGNNSCMLKGILRRRSWWNIVDNSSVDKNAIYDCNFVWTQLKNNSLFKPQNCVQSPINYPSLQQQWQLRSSFLKVQQFDSPQSEQSKYYEMMRFNSKIFNQYDFNNWCSYYQKNKKIQRKINEQTYVKRCILYTKKQIKKVCDSSKIKIHNHLQNNFYIGNKKALFYNIRRLCEYKGLNPFQYVPMTFHISKGVQDPIYQDFLNYYNKLQEIKKKDRNFRNIWICKPGENSNRGNGISVCMGLDDIKLRLRGRERNSDGKFRTFILQKYIEKPFLFKNRKFDIRHYILITCFNGNIKVYWFQQGYIRTSSSIFNLKNAKDLFVHLTNDAVQKKCDTYGKHQKGNKISYEQFQKYLNVSHRRKKIDFLGKTLDRMKQLAITTIEATYSMLDLNRHEHNFQLIGLDYMIDQNFTPWLIQANTNPCLELSCPLLQKLIPNLIEQTFRICLDPFFPPPESWSNPKRQFFGQNTLLQNKFELIFDESIDGKAIQDLFKEKKSEQYDGILNKIEEDDQVFEDDGNQNWEESNVPN